MRRFSFFITLLFICLYGYSQAMNLEQMESSYRECREKCAYFDAAYMALQIAHYLSETNEQMTEAQAIWLNNASLSLMDDYEADRDSTSLADAEDFLNYAKEIWENIPEVEKNKNYITFLSLYGKMLSYKGNEEAARTYCHQTFDLAKQIEDYDLALIAMFQIAATYEGEQAIGLYKKLFIKYEEKKDTVMMARVCHCISQNYWCSLENYEKGEQYANKALELLKTSNVGNATTCNILGSLAGFYFQIGLDSRAVDIYREIIKIKVTHNLKISLTELLTYYEYVTDYRRFSFLQYPDKFKDSMEEAEMVCNNIMEEEQENPALINRAKFLLAKLYTFFRRFADAEELYMELLNNKEKLEGKNSIGYLSILQYLAYCYHLKGDIKAARDLEIKCDRYFPKMGECYNILTNSVHLKDSIMIEEYLPKTYNHYINEIKTDVSFMGSWQREEILRTGYGFFEMINPVFLFPQNELFARYAYNAAITSKGLQLNTEKSIKSSVVETSDFLLMAKHKELTFIQKQIQTSKDSAEFVSLNHKLELKEKELLSLLKEKDDFTRELDLTWQDVQKKLGDNDIAIEFVYTDSMVTVPTGDKSTAYYGALILSKGWTAPKVIKLSQMMETDSLIKNVIWQFDEENGYDREKWKDVSYELYRRIWKPLTPYIKPNGRILFSPINTLSIVPWEACVTDEGIFMNEQYEMNRLSTTKYLCTSKPSQNVNEAVLYGGLIYNPTNTVIIPQNTSPIRREGWQYLSATADEIKSIAEIFHQNKIPTNIYDKTNGTEESFKALSGKNVSLLHIATHGFYFNDNESNTFDFLNDINASFKQGRETSVLLRSGLMLSNGQKAWLEGNTSYNKEDGILLASEISLLDLHNVDLVTLSACQTGLGDIKEDGVYGLQRGFKKAGVNTLLMTLWTVDDTATQILMTQFYKNLLSGQSKQKSLLSAQKYLREYDNGRYDSPRYWAAFIMLDGLK